MLLDPVLWLALPLLGLGVLLAELGAHLVLDPLPRERVVQRLLGLIALLALALVLRTLLGAAGAALYLGMAAGGLTRLLRRLRSGRRPEPGEWFIAAFLVLQGLFLAFMHHSAWQNAGA